MKKIITVLVFLLLVSGCSGDGGTKTLTEQEINDLVDIKVSEKIASLIKNYPDGSSLDLYPSKSFDWIVTGTDIVIHIKSITTEIKNVSFESVNQDKNRSTDGYLYDDPGAAPYKVHFIITGKTESSQVGKKVQLSFSSENSYYPNFSATINDDGTFSIDEYVYYCVISKIFFIQAFIQ